MHASPTSSPSATIQTLRKASACQPAALLGRLYHGAALVEWKTLTLHRMYHSTATLLPDGRVMVAGALRVREAF